MLADLLPLLGACVAVLALVASRTRRAWRQTREDIHGPNGRGED